MCTVNVIVYELTTNSLGLHFRHYTGCSHVFPDYLLTSADNILIRTALIYIPATKDIFLFLQRVYNVAWSREKQEKHIRIISKITE